eukprot:gnl/MRDRNA2_/MRDRNA2_512241_c0_seq1.p1 gnl/MRDRNA2_/MRDRNA2_512241_c0~~gnl/MRDRNA2_/MRDRNA2_512241_c0_seq1.p1  ORF type:complete len:116 (+),score=18.64 gnl/MRDRNA2_/MRDRNA2_512241_c0_seq1:48-350(+)
MFSENEQQREKFRQPQHQQAPQPHHQRHQQEHPQLQEMSFNHAGAPQLQWIPQTHQQQHGHPMNHSSPEPPLRDTRVLGRKEQQSLEQLRKCYNLPHLSL